MKLNVPEIPRGIPSENEFDRMGIQEYCESAETGAEYATQIQGRIPKRYESSHCLTC